LTKIPEIITKLQSFLTLDKRYLEFIARFIIVLLEKRTCNITQLCNALNMAVEIASNKRRSRRFLKQSFDLQAQISKWILSYFPREHLLLSFDRTEWKIGQTPINFLVLSLTIKQFSFAIACDFLGKAGSSSSSEVIGLLSRVQNCFVGRHVTLLADREFFSAELAKDLRLKKWHFDFRIKKDAIVRYRGSSARPEHWFKHLKKGYGSWLKRKVVIYGQSVYLACLRLTEPTEDGDEYLFVVTDKAPSVALGMYAYRWGIENLFQALKSRGFNLEATRIREKQRLLNLIALLTLALFWAFLLGALVSQAKPIKVLKHGRLEKSIFRLGLDALERLIRGGNVKGVTWKVALEFLNLENGLSIAFNTS
jgi:Transposase DDE domain